jgi:RNA polymerase-binding transcription factor DksA
MLPSRDTRPRSAMTSRFPRIELLCPHCGTREQLDEQTLLTRLQSEGMLRREKEPSWDLAVQLLRSRVDEFSCRDCYANGLRIEDRDHSRADDWDDVRRCERCSEPIPSERLEVFPDSKLCSACQRKSEQGDSGEAAEFCSHCGAILTLQQSRRGLVHYVMRCPECGRS